MLICIFYIASWGDSGQLYAQNRAVAVLYDNSGSMRDAGQCEGINYAMQVLVGLLHPQDELYVYKMDAPAGNYVNLNGKKASMTNIAQVYDCNAKVTPFEAVINAKGKLAASNRRDKWLIILSDGMITDKAFANKYPTDLSAFVAQSGARIIFLNVNATRSPLDDYFAQTATPQQTLNTQGNFEQIIRTMEQIGATVMTISGQGMPYTPLGNKLQINTPIPLKRLIVLQQEAQKNAALPNIKAATAQGKPLFIEDTYTAQKAKNEYQMTGYITHIRAEANDNAVIRKGDLTLEFNGAIKSDKLKILPEVAAKLVIDIEGSVKSKNGQQRNICDTVRQLNIVAQLLDFNEQPLDEGVLKAAKVFAVDENTKRKIPLAYNASKKKYYATLPINQKQIILSVNAEYSGYFNFQSQVISISKDACPIPKAYLEASKRKIKAHVTDMANAETLTVFPKIIVGNGEPRNPTAAEMNDLEIVQLNQTDIGVSVEKDEGKMIIKPAGSWCACFTKTGSDSVLLQLKSRNPNLQVGQQNRISINVEITDDTFWAKCAWLIVTALMTLLLLWYIWGLVKKPRFCRGAEVVFSKITTLQSMKARSYPLPTGFFNRYLVPYLPERQVVGTVKFKAGARCSHILIDRDAQTENMFVSGFPIENPRQKDIRLSNGEKLEISRSGNNKEIYEYRKI